MAPGAQLQCNWPGIPNCSCERRRATMQSEVTHARHTSGEFMNRQLALVSLFLLTITLGSCSSGNPSAGLGVYPKAVGAADEGFAIQALRTIATAEAQLKVTRGAYGDFTALTEAGLLDQRFASIAPNLKGYRFTLQASDADFAVNADPQVTETKHT